MKIEKIQTIKRKGDKQIIFFTQTVTTISSVFLSTDGIAFSQIS